MTTTFQVDDVVQYSEPYPDEVGLTLTIIEWNGIRGFAKANVDLPFPPVVLVHADQIERVKK